MTSGQGKTYVLVHGAFHGGWCWREVATLLRAAGHQVYTPTLTGLGERSHLMSVGPSLDMFVDDVMQVIRLEDLTDVILVGHSFSGAVITGVADHMGERLRHLVYLDAMILRSGECAAEVSPPGHIDRYRERAIEVDGVPCSVPFGREYFGVRDPDRSEWLARKLTPHPLRTYYDRLILRNPLGNVLPATYIAAANPIFPTTARSRAVARAIPGWIFREIPTGHNAMTTLPGPLSDMLAEIG